MFNPGVNQTLRGNGASGLVRLADQRAAGGAARTPGSTRRTWPRSRRSRREIQQVAFEEAPTCRSASTSRPRPIAATLTGVLKGLPLFWSLRKG